MFSRRNSPTLPLPVEDGTISAQTLKLDRETAEKSYETITFGLG
ncbi:hypothetical protein VSU19_20575 [Verrucomicrobiales bacterium BCK34]|nr:hypothetical protein [Verrucomicrobiales bacterium BCK34]